MLAWMDDEALHRTLTTGRATYWSRSRGEYWVKGETSGHRQWVRDVRWTATATRCWCWSTRRARPATPASAAASTARCRPSRGAAREVRRHHAQPRGVRARCDQPVVPVTRRLLADSETAVGIYRKLAGNRPGHRAAGVGRAGQAVVAVQLRRRAQRRRPDRAGRRHRSGWATPCPGSPTTCPPTRWPPSGRWPAGCARRACPACPR